MREKQKKERDVGLNEKRGLQFSDTVKVTYFLNAVEMAAFSPAFMSSLEKKPKPDAAVAGFGGLLFSGPLMLLQTEEPLPVAPERDTLTSG